jgi:hypothetical protein
LAIVTMSDTACDVRYGSFCFSSSVAEQWQTVNSTVQRVPFAAAPLSLLSSSRRVALRSVPDIGVHKFGLARAATGLTSLERRGRTLGISSFLPRQLHLHFIQPSCSAGSTFATLTTASRFYALVGLYIERENWGSHPVFLSSFTSLLSHVHLCCSARSTRFITCCGSHSDRSSGVPSFVSQQLASSSRHLSPHLHSRFPHFTSTTFPWYHTARMRGL